MCDKNYNLTSYLKNGQSGRLNDGISLPEKSEIKKHLEACADCRTELNELKSILGALKQIEVIEPSADFESKVMQKIDKITAPDNAGLRVMASLSGLWSKVVQTTDSISEDIRMRLRYSPAWLVSGAIHIILFAFLGLILIQPTQKYFENKYKVDMGTPVAIDKFALPSVSDLPSFASKPITKPVEYPADNPLREKIFLTHIINNRTTEKRIKLLKKYGGDESTEYAVAQGLKYLKSAQEPDGSWNPEKYGGLKEYKIGLTALTLLTFLSDGASSEKSDNSKTVKSGIDYLVANQQTNGLFGPIKVEDKSINYMYNHGIATLAVLEDYCMTNEKGLESVIANAVKFMLNAQNDEGGWGYIAHNGINDSLVTSWQVFALRIAKDLNIEGASGALNKTGSWIASITDKNGIVGYRAINHHPNGYYATTSAGMFSQLFIGMDKNNAVIAKQEKILSQYLPEMHAVNGEMDNDFYYWHFGTIAMIQKGGEAWDTWNKYIKETLVKNQSGAATQTVGSWEQNDRWGFYGGKLYTTSMSVLALQSYYRYDWTKG